MSAVSSEHLAMLTIETKSNLRNSESFDAFYDLCLREIQNIKFVEEPVFKRKREEPKYSLLNYLEGYESRSEAHHPTTPRDHYRKQFYQAINVLISSVRDRFDQPSFSVFENLESLLIKTLKDEEISTEMKIVREKSATDVNMSDLNIQPATCEGQADRTLPRFAKRNEAVGKPREEISGQCL